MCRKHPLCASRHHFTRRRHVFLLSFPPRIKEFEGAVDFFTRAVKINTRFLDAYIGRGNSYMEYGQDDGLKQAQKDFLKALHIDPSCLKARISLGYNLQVNSNNIFSAENIVWTGERDIWLLIGDVTRCSFSGCGHLVFLYCSMEGRSREQGLS